MQALIRGVAAEHHLLALGLVRMAAVVVLVATAVLAVDINRQERKILMIRHLKGWEQGHPQTRRTELLLCIRQAAQLNIMVAAASLLVVAVAQPVGVVAFYPAGLLYMAVAAAALHKAHIRQAELLSLAVTAALV